MKTSHLIGLSAETFIHPGSGRSQGAIDLPVTRERTTSYPFIAGSSVKGAVKNYAEDTGFEDIKANFGEQDAAGKLVFSDWRLLLLPVRSLTSNYKWLTCPQIISRLSRDLNRIGYEIRLDDFKDNPTTYKQINQNPANGVKKLFLEELSFQETRELSPDDKLVELLSRMFADVDDDDIASKLVIVPDDDFKWFASSALTVQARNVLDKETKSSENLWYEEYLPPDTLMYGYISGRAIAGNAVDNMIGHIKENPFIQVGGNETIGMGWFKMNIYTNTAQKEAKGDKNN